MLKNIDDFWVFGKTLKDLEIQIDKLAKLCRRINLKLAPSKFSLSTSLEAPSSWRRRLRRTQ